MNKAEEDRMGLLAVAEARTMYRRMLAGWCSDYLACRAAWAWRANREHPAAALPTSVLDD